MILFPDGAIASDAVMWQVDGRVTHADIWPLPENAFAHPRSAGTFSRFLRVYVRERQALSLRDALAKTSLIPARILEGSVPQMRRKGRIAPDMDADLVVFDLATIADRATTRSLHRSPPAFAMSSSPVFLLSKTAPSIRTADPAGRCGERRSLNGDDEADHRHLGLAATPGAKQDTRAASGYVASNFPLQRPRLVMLASAAERSGRRP